MYATKKSFILCLLLSASCIPSYSMDCTNTYTDEEMENRSGLYDLDAPIQRASCLSRICTWKHVCTYGAPIITIAGSTAIASILVYQWMNPTISAAQEDLTLARTVMQDMPELIDNAKTLMHKTNIFLDKAIQLVDQANEAAPGAKSIIEQVEVWYPYVDYAIHKFINVTEMIEHLFGKHL
ncbi:MAG TPA: hypothetical protein PLU71_04815 [Candidatus Dependentiae bacterium]|nr:hypothetical protein [Candidatus Dependentiae bacterium]HRQ63156.1 hypothetical protein [Candidatus Dependentiae bacterium]